MQIETCEWRHLIKARFENKQGRYFPNCVLKLLPQRFVYSAKCFIFTEQVQTWTFLAWERNSSCEWVDIYIYMYLFIYIYIYICIYTSSYIVGVIFYDGYYLGFNSQQQPSLRSPVSHTQIRQNTLFMRVLGSCVLRTQINVKDVNAKDDKCGRIFVSCFWHWKAHIAVSTHLANRSFCVWMEKMVRSNTESWEARAHSEENLFFLLFSRLGCWHLKQEQVSGTDVKKLDKFQELAKKTGTGFWNFENGKDIASFTLEIS